MTTARIYVIFHAIDGLEIRDRLIYYYFGVDLMAIWKTLQENLLFLNSTIHRMVAEALHGTV